MPLGRGQPPARAAESSKYFPLVGQVLGAGVGLDGVSACSSVRGSASDAGGDLAGVAVQHRQSPVVHPCLRSRVAFSEEAPRRAEHVLQHVDHVDHVDHDGNFSVSGLGLFLDAVEPVVVAVDQGHPAACVAGSRRWLRRKPLRSPWLRHRPRSRSPTTPGRTGSHRVWPPDG